MSHIGPSVHILLEPLLLKYLHSTSSDGIVEFNKQVKSLIEYQSRHDSSDAAFSVLAESLAQNALDLLNYDSKDYRFKLAGFTIFDNLLDVNEDAMPGGRVLARSKYAADVRKAVEYERLPLEVYAPVLRLASVTLGHLARVGSAADNDFLQTFYLPIAFKALKPNRSDCNKYAAALILTQLSIHNAGSIYARNSELFSNIWEVICDKNAAVRGAAAEALDAGLQLVSQRSQEQMEDYLKKALRQMDTGFICKTSERITGSLLILDIALGSTVPTALLHDKMREEGLQFHDIIWKVLQLRDSRDTDIKNKVIDIIPKLASSFMATFLQPNQYTNPHNFLQYTVKYLLETIRIKKDRPLAYISLGKLVLSMTSALRSSTLISDILTTITDGFKEPFCVMALQCLAMVMNVSQASRKYINTELIDAMFRGGLTPDLITTLKIVLRHIPGLRSHIQNQLRMHISTILLRYAVVVDETQLNLIQGRPLASNQGNFNFNKNVSKRPSAGFGTAFMYTPTKDSPVKQFTWGNVFQSLTTDSSTSTSNADNLLILALNVLASSDFFVKQQRDTPAELDQSSNLLLVLKDSVVRYLDDYNPDIRIAAASTCSLVLDAVVLNIDPQREEYSFMLQIIDRLLLLGVGDDSPKIRKRIFSSFSASLDYAIHQSENLHCLMEGLEDESMEVRTAAMALLSRVAQYNTLQIMPILTVNLKRVLKHLQTTKDNFLRQENVQLLQAIVRGANTLILPYVRQILEPLLMMINDPSTAVVEAALSTIGDLAVSCPDIIRERLEEIFPRLIDALNDQTNISKQEIAVTAIGKIASSLVLIADDPYVRYSGLFECLAEAIQTEGEETEELRLQAIRTVGLLGVVDKNVYQAYLLKNANAFDSAPSDSYNVVSESDDIELENKENKLSKSERYYFTVVMKAIMSILQDLSLSAFHQGAAGVAVRVIRIVGVQDHTYLCELVDVMIHRLYKTEVGNALRDNLLDHIVTLIHGIGQQMRKRLNKLISLTCDFFDSHLQQCLDIIESLALVLQSHDFELVLRSVLPTMIKVLKEEPFNSYPNNQQIIEDRSKQPMNKSEIKEAALNKEIKKVKLPKSCKILQTIANVADNLGEYKRQLIPVIVNTINDDSTILETRKLALKVVIRLGKDPDLPQFASRIIHPILGLLSRREPTMQTLVLTALSCLLCRLGENYFPYIIPVKRKILSTFNQSTGGAKLPQLEEYENLVSRLMKKRPLPVEPSDMSDIAITIDERVKSRANLLKSRQTEGTLEIGMQQLEAGWALAGRTSASTLADWMKRLSAALISQSPSPIIRSCQQLVKQHAPLAEHLFNAAFVCIWDELFSSDPNEVFNDLTLIDRIEMALQSSYIPPHIRNALLNLAEFMDMQDKRLPLDVQLLARRAESANMFAKCLRYREIEFNSQNVLPSAECIEALISVNNELGLPDRATGVLTVCMTNFSHIEIRPLWLEKLNRWDDALQTYTQEIMKFRFESGGNENPTKNTKWMESELGALRCLRSLGEFDDLGQKAMKLKDFVRQDEQSPEYKSWMSQIQTLGANAAWMLGRWDIMENLMEGEILYDLQDVEVTNCSSFYRAVLAIHKEDYSHASKLISFTRHALTEHIRSLLSENYSRAYSAMVSMQVLAEMEEVIEYKQTLLKAELELELASTGASKNKNYGEDNISRSSSGLRLEELLYKTDGAHVDVVAAKKLLLQKWRGWLKHAPKEVEVYRQILAVRTLVADPKEDLDSWLSLVTLSRKEGMYSLTENLLRQLGAPLPIKINQDVRSQSDVDLASVSVEDDPVYIVNKPNERVLFSMFKYQWHCDNKQLALSQLSKYIESLEPLQPLDSNKVTELDETRMFRVRCLLKKADWMRELDDEYTLTEVLDTVMQARSLAPNHYSVWHAWAVTNYDQLKKADKEKGKDINKNISRADSETDIFGLGTKKKTNGSMMSIHDSYSNSQLNAILLKSLKNSSPTQHNRKLTSPSPLQRLRGKDQLQSNHFSSSQFTFTAGSASLANLLSVNQQEDHVTQYVINAINGFARSIVLGQGQPVANILQDTLRLLTLWFTYGSKEGVRRIVEDELGQVSPDIWLSVIPQLIARMNLKAPPIAKLLKKILMKLAENHPQALVCPISVALNTNDYQQKLVASEILTEMRKLNSQLVSEATMVSTELMRVAVTPHELWHDGLEKAATEYVESKDLNAMVMKLTELHDAMNDTGTDKKLVYVGFPDGTGKIGRSCLRDISFRNSYDRYLTEAQDWLIKFKRSGRTTDLHQAWDIYQFLFKRLKMQILNFKKAKVELPHVSPGLTNALNLELAVPGTYNGPKNMVRINSFSHSVTVIPSKQRPRRISILGNDGRQYQFLLKGNEDLRQDERVMQLFRLINVCLDNTRSTSNIGLGIIQYSVLPLSNNSGLIGWVENCDTLNQLVVQYRDSHNLSQNIESKLVQNKSPGEKRGRVEQGWDSYYKLPLLHKVHIFKQVQEETTGQDLSKMLWLKSKTADVWVERRANFTKSSAVMSMVGYILGLGDRHPSNLMLDRVSGRVVHIDFGDCFEVTAKRAICPEIVPFRLTRMLTNAMETSGIEGTYRVNCERTMRVLRENRDSVMAMLEAFVYDPLISWRLLKSTTNDMINSWDAAATGVEETSAVDRIREQIPTGSALGLSVDDEEEGLTSVESGIVARSMAASMKEGKTVRKHGKSIDESSGDSDADTLNARALEVITRIQAKLTGRDFVSNDDDDDLKVDEQVYELIKEATSEENLCQLYIGWCALW